MSQSYTQPFVLDAADLDAAAECAEHYPAGVPLEKWGHGPMGKRAWPQTREVQAEFG